MTGITWKIMQNWVHPWHHLQTYWIKSLPKKPNWVYTGDRRQHILHAILRMLYSPLNDHLYSLIYVVDSPSCNLTLAGCQNQVYWHCAMILINFWHKFEVRVPTGMCGQTIHSIGKQPWERYDRKYQGSQKTPWMSW